jgi:alanyl-tRNA synthetase
VATPRLHYDDPLILRAEAEVIAHGRRDDHDSIVLTETIFYPESGGQMGDQGTIGGARVGDVQLDAEGVVHHLVTGGELPSVGSVVACAVDAPRRRQHMALHTGQHVLSRALLDLHDAVTVSSRLGASGCTIDVDRSGLDLEALADVQARANEIVDEDRAVRQYFPDPSTLAALPLRKPPPEVEGRVRIVDVGGFDVTPCGGTHVTHTAQIELVLLRAAERYKGGTRITFEAGPRARAALLAHRDAVVEAAAVLRCAPHELVEATRTQLERLDTARREADALRGSLADRWAEALGSRADDTIVATLLGADAALLKEVASRLTSGARRLALAAPSDDGVAVLIAMGPQADGHAGEAMRALARETGGRGGGRAEHAQGRLPKGASFEPLITEILERTRPSGSG